MSYYILPKSNNKLILNPCVKNAEFPYVSASLYNQFNSLTTQWNNFKDTNLLFSKNEIENYINPYFFLYSTAFNSNLNVSKLNFDNSLFYEILEIVNNLNILQPFKNDNITISIISNQFDHVCKAINYSRKENSDIFLNILIDDPLHTKCNIVVIDKSCSDYDGLTYFQFLICILKVILNNLDNSGVCIIKIADLFDKTSLEFVYILTTLFDKTFIINPNASCPFSLQKYIVCKHFTFSEDFFDHLYFEDNIKYNTFINVDLPVMFVNKINDINIITGQKNLESLVQKINLFNNKHDLEKLSIIRKSNVEKCVLWCEKNKIPCNKFLDKTNIFLLNEQINEIDDFSEDISSVNKFLTV
jgi:hypothetical protein